MTNNHTSTYDETLNNLTEERKSEIKLKYLDVDPEQLLVRRKEGMGFFARLKDDRKSQAVASRQMGEIHVVMLETQRELIVQKCTLGLDVAKKALFLQYLQETESKNKDMYNMSAEIDAALSLVYDAKIDQVDDMVSSRLSKLEMRKSSGKISTEVFSIRKGDMLARADKRVANLAARLDKLIMSHAKVYEQATDVLKQRVIGNAGII